MQDKIGRVVAGKSADKDVVSKMSGKGKRGRGARTETETERQRITSK